MTVVGDVVLPAAAAEPGAGSVWGCFVPASLTESGAGAVATAAELSWGLTPLLAELAGVAPLPAPLLAELAGVAPLAPLLAEPAGGAAGIFMVLFEARRAYPW